MKNNQTNHEDIDELLPFMVFASAFNGIDSLAKQDGLVGFVCKLLMPKPDPNEGYWCFYSCCPEAGLEISVLRHPTKSVKYNFHVNYERLRKNTYLDGTESNKDIQFIAHLRLGIYMERIVKPSLGLDVLKSTK